MGEESTTPVYIGKYEDSVIKFEPLGEFAVTDMDIDIENAYADDVVAPMRYIQTIMKQPITIRAFLRLKDLRRFYKAIGMPAYLRTEYLFPKKKKRGTARRKRRMKRAEQRFISFVHAKYGGDLIGTQATNVIIDDFFIPDGAIPESEFEFVIKDSTFAGPFEGEED